MNTLKNVSKQGQNAHTTAVDRERYADRQKDKQTKGELEKNVGTK